MVQKETGRLEEEGGTCFFLSAGWVLLGLPQQWPVGLVEGLVWASSRFRHSQTCLPGLLCGEQLLDGALSGLGLSSVGASCSS